MENHFSILKVYYYDFFTKKVGTKKTNEVRLSKCRRMRWVN